MGSVAAIEATRALLKRVVIGSMARTTQPAVAAASG